jgi:serine/threonine-protein kinase
VDASEGLLADLAGAILDGDAIDWPSAETGAGLGDRALLNQLRVLATVADVYRDASSTVPALEDNDRRRPQRNDQATKHWGHLRLLDRIGCGAFGEVYRAWDPRLDREVALKLLPASAANGSACATAIIDEGRLLARVRHPNVVTIYGADWIADRIGLWMELIKGRTLQQAVEEGTGFSATEVVDIGIEICRAVTAVHEAGLVHGDIKPHNVMLAEDRRLVLMDLGVGRELGANSSAVLVGTPLYMAPELLRGENPTIHSDIYSLGVLLFYLVTGKYPVRGQSLRELCLAHDRRESTDVRRLRPDVSPKLARVIRRAIDPEAERRYPSARSLQADLQALKPRPLLVRVPHALGAAAAVVIVATLGWEVGARQLRISTTPTALLARLLELTRVGPPHSPEQQPVIAVPPPQSLSAEADSDQVIDDRFAVTQGLEERSRPSEILAALQAEPGKHIADIGAADGAYSFRIARAVGPEGRVTAVEVNPEYLAKLRARVKQDNVTNVDVVAGAFDDPRLPGNTFDAVLIDAVYPEMPAPEPVMKSIFVALKAGGRLVMTEPLHDNLRTAGRDKQVENHEIGPNFVEQELQAAGFEIIELRPDFLPFTGPAHKGKGGKWLMVARKPQRQ